MRICTLPGSIWPIATEIRFDQRQRAYEPFRRRPVRVCKILRADLGDRWSARPPVEVAIILTASSNTFGLFASIA